MRKLYWLLLACILLMGCSDRYVESSDAAGRNHCRDVKTGEFVKIDKCRGQ